MTTAGSFDAPIDFRRAGDDMSPADLRTASRRLPGCHFQQWRRGDAAGAASALRAAGRQSTVNYVKTYETLNAALRTMVLDSNGVLYKETTPARS